MKKLYFFPFAIAAALMLSACSDDVSDANPTPVSSGYVSFNINLPTTSGNGTRAYTGEFEDGNEYEVKTGKLLLFSGTSETDAKYIGMYDLENLLSDDTPDDPQVTQTNTYNAVAVLNGLSGTDFMALVILNPNTDLLSKLSLTNGTSTLATLNSTSVDVTVENLKSNGFMMSNAPLSDTQGGDVTTAPSNPKIQTLVKFDASKIYENSSDAISNPAATVNVERAVAKVTLEGIESEDDTEKPTKIASYDINGWTLDYTNKKTYLVRNVGFSNATWAYKNTAGTAGETTGYRFLEKEALQGQSLYRTYYAIDPNYGGTGYTWDAAEFDIKTGTNTGDLAKADGKEALYCTENTFDVDHMNWKNTTRAIVSATLNMNSITGNDKSFIVIGDDKSVVYTPESAANYVVMNYLESTYRNSNTKIELDLPENGGYAKIKSVTVSGTENETLKNDLNKRIEEKALKLAYYKDGKSYYQIRIKHFGDVETPWHVDEIAGATVSYPGTDKENNWLGRYGVVRNTKYEISVTGVKEIGDPEIPSGGGDNPDDEVPSQYLSVKINVLSWAVRKQSATLE